MPRSLRKGPYIDERLLEKIRNLKPDGKTVIRTWARDATITPEMVGFTFGVHNGKNFVQVTVREEMVGHRLGEFSPPTKFVRHGGRLQRELEQKTLEAQEQAAQTPGAPTQASPKQGSEK